MQNNQDQLNETRQKNEELLVKLQAQRDRLMRDRSTVVSAVEPTLVSAGGFHPVEANGAPAAALVTQPPAAQHYVVSNYHHNKALIESSYAELSNTNNPEEIRIQGLDRLIATEASFLKDQPQTGFGPVELFLTENICRQIGHNHGIDIYALGLKGLQSHPDFQSYLGNKGSLLIKTTLEALSELNQERGNIEAIKTGAYATIITGIKNQAKYTTSRSVNASAEPHAADINITYGQPQSRAAAYASQPAAAYSPVKVIEDPAQDTTPARPRSEQLLPSASDQLTPARNTSNVSGFSTSPERQPDRLSVSRSIAPAISNAPVSVERHIAPAPPIEVRPVNNTRQQQEQARQQQEQELQDLLRRREELQNAMARDQQQQQEVLQAAINTEKQQIAARYEALVMDRHPRQYQKVFADMLRDINEKRQGQNPSSEFNQLLSAQEEALNEIHDRLYRQVQEQEQDFLRQLHQAQGQERDRMNAHIDQIPSTNRSQRAEILQSLKEITREELAESERRENTQNYSDHQNASIKTAQLRARLEAISAALPNISTHLSRIQPPIAERSGSVEHFLEQPSQSVAAEIERLNEALTASLHAIDSRETAGYEQIKVEYDRAVHNAAQKRDADYEAQREASEADRAMANNEYACSVAEINAAEAERLRLLEVQDAAREEEDAINRARQARESREAEAERRAATQRQEIFRTTSQSGRTTPAPWGGRAQAVGGGVDLSRSLSLVPAAQLRGRPLHASDYVVDHEQQASLASGGRNQRALLSRLAPATASNEGQFIPFS